MARNHGYIYYEADCYMQFQNPFIDPKIDEPTLAIGLQTPLKVILKNHIFKANDIMFSYLNN